MPETTTQHRDSVRFSGNVSPSSEESQSYDVEEDATIEEVVIRFYSGPRLDLHVRPYVEQNSGRSVDEVDLIDYAAGANEYIAGDNDVWVFPVSESISKEDTIVVDAENVDPDHDYDFVCDMTLDHQGGVARSLESFIGNVRSRIQGVL